VAARPGVGKTALALNILARASFDKKSCLFFSQEMPDLDIAQRLLCTYAEVDNYDVKSSKRLTPEQLARVNRAVDEIANVRLHIEDSSKQTVETMIRQAREIKAKDGLDLVVIDYIGLITPVQKSGKRHEDIAEVSRCIKVMCKDLDVPIVVLCQLDRGLDREDTQPTLSHLRESGAIEQDADVVIFIHPKSSTFEPEYDVDFIIAKNRHGQKKAIKAHYKGSIFKFTEKDAPPSPKPQQISATMTPVDDAEMPF
jgi:replicative DNA helicase